AWAYCGGPRRHRHQAAHGPDPADDRRACRLRRDERRRRVRQDRVHPLMGTHLITGAGSGIGAAVADALRARGDDLVVLARHQERADTLAERFPGAATIVADLADPEAVDRLTGLPDRLDSVLHVAGVVEL